jgi:DNA-3-methyladenine glycosylase I
MTKYRCSWCGDDPLYQKYHDEEWGVPVHSDRKLFEMLCLEGAQAGLSWITILRKRKNYRKAFDHFDPKKIARYTKSTVRTLMKNEGTIRNRLKIESVITNAKAFLEVRKEFGTFDNYIWRFVDGTPIKHRRRSIKKIPSTTRISDSMSRDLKQRGFRFVGSTICYSFMQACGLVDDHVARCFKNSKR